MIVFPSCKINIGLYILSKRSDGYHNLLTCFYPVKALSDILEIVPSNTFVYTQSGLVISGDEESNLVVKAYRLIQQRHQCSAVKIHLHKCIPMGAGLGGGSADAAFALTLLNEVLQLNLPGGQLKQYAAELGSDCPFFIDNLPAIGEGKGEKLTSVTLPQLEGKYILLVKPDIHISTKEAYDNCRCRQENTSILQWLNLPLEKWQQTLHNDFEDTLFPKYPVLAEIKNRLLRQGAAYASLSGSGATVYGIFDRQPMVDHWKQYGFVFSTKI